MKRIAILASDNDWERNWRDALERGIVSHGDTVATEAAARNGDADAVAFVGVKRKADYDYFRSIGVTTIMFDKGYNRDKVAGYPKYWRIAINAHSCTGDIDFSADHARVHTLGVELMPWRSSGDHILYAGSSAKYHAFCDLPPPERYVQDVCAYLKDISEYPVLYRPKPSYMDAKEIEAAEMRRAGRINDALRDVHAVVTHGSNACFEAVCAGVPCIILGGGVARPISSTSLDDINSPYLASDSEREAWLNGLSYWQWSRAEMENGKCWDYVRQYVN